jgi:hypothetical protein
MVEKERNIVEEGLELGLSIRVMKFACPLLGICQYELGHSDRKDLRLTTCHNAVNYKLCGAYRE